MLYFNVEYLFKDKDHHMVSQQDVDRLKALFARIEEGSAGVCVMGSANVDYTVETERLPKPGETVSAGPLRILPGGKSANQAASAGKAGATVTMLGMVGTDDNGSFLLSQLSDAHVDVSKVERFDGPSGSTVITVDAEGENTIVYSSGSNAHVSAGYVEKNRDTLDNTAVLGLCLESPMDAVIRSAQICHRNGVPVLLNDSPFVAELPQELVDNTDILLVNEHEMAQLLGLDINEDDLYPQSPYWQSVAAALEKFGYTRAIVTLGSHGAIAFEPGKAEYIPAVKVSAVDTTGCGDSFMGTILAGLSARLTLADSAWLASYVAAYAATGLGAQASYGTAAQITEFFAAMARQG